MEFKLIKHNNKKYYLIDTLENFGNSCQDFELYESCRYGEDVPCLLVNDSTRKAIGFTCNGFDELYDNEYIETITTDYTILKK